MAIVAGDNPVAHDLWAIMHDGYLFKCAVCEAWKTRIGQYSSGHSQEFVFRIQREFSDLASAETIDLTPDNEWQISAQSIFQKVKLSQEFLF